MTDSYWDTDKSQAAAGGGVVDAAASGPPGVGKTTAELMATTGTGSADYTGIYVNWNVDLDGDGNADDPWDFGSTSSYPTVSHRVDNTLLPGQR